MNERKTAFDILLKIEKDKAYSNLLLDSVLTDGKEDSSFVRFLVYGVVERKITLDYYLSLYLKQPINKLKPHVLVILRMGAFQLKYMDSVPDFSAVNESVKLAKQTGCSYASGLINSVLRRISEVDTQLPSDDSPESMSIRYSCPEELVSQYIGDYGTEDAKGILENALKVPPLYLRVNTFMTDTDKLMSLLDKAGVKSEKCSLADNALKITDGNVFESGYISEGLCYVQDLSSQICAAKLGAVKGETVYDMCSAPGSKAYTIAQYMENEGLIRAFDLHPHRVELIKKGAAKLGIDIIDAAVSDSSVFDSSLAKADRVLCDVPCSGLGVIRRKPEIRYKELSQIGILPDLQYNILLCSAEYLKVGGTLIYSTCSLNKKENESVCDRFLNVNPAFVKTEDYMTLFPHENDTDGFFIACFTRNE